ncbi:carboxymuconolactone decarboxylase family protein [Desulfovibrio aminophilus]|nr:carboxymuconolactone decarboxylase family protein [Desulfovibrio aminophilus]MCM0754547.1 carboxymuconolactone decarboxylase family protein [Desulfovibrio aminophilus]
MHVLLSICCVCAVLALSVIPARAAGESEGETCRRGRALLDRLNPGAFEQVRASLEGIAPDMVRYVVEFGYGELYSRPGLTMRQRQTATVAALAALGNAAPQLRFHVGAGLAAGLSPEEVVEIIYVTTVFAGFPAGLNALSEVRTVFAERGVAPTAAPEPSGTPRERGLAALAASSKGTGQAVLDSLKDIAPDMGRFILDFSYGEVFCRPGLEPGLKEIAMIAAATARGTMRPQLVVHIRAGLNVGLSREEIVEVIVQMAAYAGFPAALNGLDAAREAFGS